MGKPELGGKPEPLGDPLRDLAVPREDRNVHLRRLGEATLNGLGQLFRRRAREEAGDGSDEDRGKLRPVSEVEALQLSTERDLVAPRRRQQVAVGVAADVAEQRLMIDGAAHGLVEARGVGHPHRENTGPQRKVSRMPGGEVSRVGQRHQKVSTSNGRCAISFARGH